MELSWAVPFCCPFHSFPKHHVLAMSVGDDLLLRTRDGVKVSQELFVILKEEGADELDEDDEKCVRPRSLSSFLALQSLSRLGKAGKANDNHGRYDQRRRLERHLRSIHRRVEHATMGPRQCCPYGQVDQSTFFAAAPVPCDYYRSSRESRVLLLPRP